MPALNFSHNTRFSTARHAAIEDARSEQHDLPMSPEEFAVAIKLQAFEPAVTGVLSHLGDGGRNLHPGTDALSAWFNALSQGDQSMVAEVARDAAHAAIYGVLCILDGVRAIDEPPHGDLVLTAVTATGETSVIASRASIVELHDEFNAVVPPPSEGWPPAE